MNTCGGALETLVLPSLATPVRQRQRDALLQRYCEVTMVEGQARASPYQVMFSARA